MPDQKTYGVIDCGSFCDFTLTFALVKSIIARGHKVILITDYTNKLAPGFIEQKPAKSSVHVANDNITVVRYVPIMKDLTSNPELINKYAATHVDLWDKMDVGQLYYDWHKNTVWDLLAPFWPKIDRIVIHYPALTFIASMPKDFLEKTPMCIFYVAPGYPNIDNPWVFSQRLQWRDFAIRPDDAASQIVNYESSKKYWLQVSAADNVFKGLALMFGFGGDGESLIEKIAKRALIISTWDPVYLPPTRPLPSNPNELYVKQAGAILDMGRMNHDWVNDTTHERAPQEVTDFVRTSNGNMIYMSTGSFEINPQQLISSILDSDPTATILFHDLKKVSFVDGKAEDLVMLPEMNQLQQNLPGRVMIWTTPFAHEWIVPNSKYIVTTGSICLVNIALYHAKPLIIVPIITEQFFWGKNYFQQCGVPYVFVQDPQVPVSVQVANTMRALLDPKVAAFHEAIKNSIRGYNGTEMIVDLIENNIADRMMRKFAPGECEQMKDALRRVGAEILRRNPSADIRDLPALLAQQGRQ
jgi:UDP:flavonoid glycosyltransferase YjiC (YdhE family)